MKSFDTKHIIGNIRNVFDYDPAKMEPSPYRDWVVLIIGFFSLLLLSAGVGVYLFLAVSGGDVFAPHAPVGDEEGPFSVEEFANLNTLYQEKEARLEALLVTPPVRPSDPSQ